MSNRLSQIVARNIEARRTVRAWSWAEVSDRLAEAGQPIPVLGLRRMIAGKRSVTVEELAAIARLFGVEPWTLTVPPDCDVCFGSPPAGFSCNHCAAVGH